MLRNVSKIKIVFFLLLNILVVWYLYYGQKTTVSFTSYPTVSFQEAATKSEEDVAKSEEDSQWSSEFLNVVISGRNVNHIDLRTIDVANSTEELDYLLNIRKLILFAVHKLNKPLKYTRCAKWWANPLDLVFHNTKVRSTTHTDHLIKFRIQPGNLTMVATMRQQISIIRLDDRELEVVGSLEIPDFIGKRCHGEELQKNVTQICLCVESKRFMVYNKITTQLREIWNKTDVELLTWPPDKSFIVTDYMNFTDYDFVTSPGNTIQDVAKLHYSTEYCGPDIKMLVMVSSAPSHFEHRKTIRQTYGNSSYLEGKGFKVVFLMGIPKDSKLNDDVKHEAAITKDIIQAKFDDSYHNLTVSHLSMYKWAHLNCIEGRNSGVIVPQFIVKADDDYSINIDLALTVAQQNVQHAFIGSLFCSTKVIRNVASMRKYYTPRYMHISKSYRGYLSGVAYILRTDVIPLLLHMSITTPIIHMDDAYVSGVLLRQLDILPIRSQLVTYKRIDPDACKTKQMISSHVQNVTDMTTQWDVFWQPMPSNCTLDDLKVKVNEFTDRDMPYCHFNRRAISSGLRYPRPSNVTNAKS